METIKRLSYKIHADTDTGCLYRYVRSENEYFRLHCHDYFEIFLIVRGNITHLINGTSQTLSEGSLVFIRPDDVHNFKCRGSRTFANLTFTKETCRELFHYLSDGFPAEKLLSAPLPPLVLLKDKDFKHLLSQLEALNAIQWPDKPKLKLQIRSLLCEIFTRHFADFGQDKDDLLPIWLEQLCKEMEKRENFMEGIERMTQISGKSREHIARSMKKYLGQSPTEYVNSLRINYAANMLLNSNMPIVDLCFESGFSNVSWFYTLFQHKFHMSPGDFKKRMRSG